MLCSLFALSENLRKSLAQSETCYKCMFAERGQIAKDNHQSLARENASFAIPFSPRPCRTCCRHDAVASKAIETKIIKSRHEVRFNLGAIPHGRCDPVLLSLGSFCLVGKMRESVLNFVKRFTPQPLTRLVSGTSRFAQGVFTLLPPEKVDGVHHVLSEPKFPSPLQQIKLTNDQSNERVGAARFGARCEREVPSLLLRSV